MCILRQVVYKGVADVCTHFLAIVRGGIVLCGHRDFLAVNLDGGDVDGHIREQGGAVKYLYSGKGNASRGVFAVCVAGNVVQTALGACVDADGVISVTGNLLNPCVIGQ